MHKYFHGSWPFFVSYFTLNRVVLTLQHVDILNVLPYQAGQRWCTYDVLFGETYAVVILI